MTFYMQKENYEMLSGHTTVMFRWWIKNNDGDIQRFPAQIQHQTELKKALNLFKKHNPQGEIFKKDLTT